jgi:hypothetical protein
MEDYKVTTILNVYKRPIYLKDQMECLRNQTVKTDIWIDYTVPEGETKYNLAAIAPEAKISMRTNQNLYHLGRFYYALNAQTEYVFVIDDDIMPGKEYIQHCIETIESLGESWITGYGVTLDRKDYRYNPTNRFGWHGIPKGGNMQPIEVDMAGHSHFFKRKTLNCISREMPVQGGRNGDDLHVSAMCNKYGKVPIIVPVHDISKPERHSCDYKKGMDRGNDMSASWRNQHHNPLRDEMVQHHLDTGWSLVNER